MKDEQAKQRMKRFQELPSNTISWETFKRLLGQFGTEKGIEKAKNIIKKLDRSN
jgi:hypothetical protein|tara:strand:+ start:1320 stop:1481 length:162 start_codon:yes stop_codon:yes gene_type:complete